MNCNYVLELARVPSMAIRVVEFSSRGYKIRKVFATYRTGILDTYKDGEEAKNSGTIIIDQGCHYEM